jgi:hypothetical protein
MKYGSDFTICFYVSAKHKLADNEVRGPTVFRKTKDVEYTIFLPFAVIMKQSDPRRAALAYLFRGVYEVFKKLDIDSAKVSEKEEVMIRRICSDPEMFESQEDYLASKASNGPDVGPPLWHATPEMKSSEDRT